MELSAEAQKSQVTVNMDARKFDLWLDHQLRGMFNAVADEPVPQSLIDLVKDRGEPKP